MPPGTEPVIPEPSGIESWFASHEYLYAVDLYNHGYWWEAHEVWEGLWQASGRTGIQAEFFKGLIKCAAAQLKIEQGRLRGARTLLQQALKHLEAVRQDLGREPCLFMGLNIGELDSALREYFQSLLQEGIAHSPGEDFPRLIPAPVS